MARIRRCSPFSLAAILALLTPIRGSAGDDRAERDDHGSQGAESRDMKWIGFNDLQARSSYQPTLHKQGGRYILYVGHHTLGTNPVTGAPLPSFNPLTQMNEENGTSILDVTEPKHPRYLVHLPVPDHNGGGAQMVRVCDGALLPHADHSKVYMLRTYSNSAHEIWDVTHPEQPVGVRTVAGGNPVIGAQTGTPGALAGTHKSWWECDTGIAYIVGRRGTDTAAGWKPGNHIMIFDLSDPANPVFLRDWAMDGQQPGSKLQPHFTNAPSIHGPISTGPAGGVIASANPGVVPERVYFAYGTGATGIMQIVDRKKLLDPSIPATDFTTAELGHWVMNPDNGAHTSWPLGNIAVPDFVSDPNRIRDFVFVTSEATAHFCAEPRHLSFLVDVSDEGRPQGVSTAQVSAASGGKKDDENFCRRGGRFGPHATNEEFGPPFYEKIVFVSYFNAGVRAFDVRDPYRPRNVAFFIPPVTANTDLRCGTLDNVPNVCRQVVQTNNVATDDRGNIFIVDRANTGLHVLRLTGDAAKIVGEDDR